MYSYPQIPSDSSRPQAEGYQYYQRQPQQDRQYTQTPQAPQQQQAPQQAAPGQQLGTQSQYYQGQLPYFYQVPVAETAQGSNPQDRYQAGLYRYGNAYAAAPAAAPAPAAPGSQAGTPAASRTAAAYPPYAYGDLQMMQMMYSQQPPTQAQASPQQSSFPGNQLSSPHIAAQRPLYAPNQSAPAVAGQFRGMQPPQAGQPQLAPMPMNQGRAVAPATPPSGHRATVSTHLSAIPVTMPVTDPTGQTAPPGIKPRVTTTLWEDEGTTCFQVEARGFCVARREDNDMINGTKLLNVAGMTRGRRDGLLKGERNRHVVKAGAMHLKGVWIPYDRALDFANKERIVDLLYPLFVTDIKSVLYQPGTQDMRHAVPGQPPAGGAAPAQHPQHPQHPQAHAQHPQAPTQPVVAPQQHQMPHIQGGQPTAPSAPQTASHTPAGNVPNGASASVPNGPVPGVPGAVTPQGAAPGGGPAPGQNGAPGPVGVVPGVGGGGPHLPVVQQIGQPNEHGGDEQSGNTQLPQLEGLAGVQSGIENHQALPQSPYGLPQKPKTEIEENSGQQRHYEPEKGQYYSYDGSQAAPQPDAAQQRQGYF